MSSKVGHLIVDTAGFISTLELHRLFDMADHVVTLDEVISEIRDKATRQRMKALPYDLEMVTPTSEFLCQVASFAKKTGDFSVLSLTDLKVLAATLMLEKKYVGSIDHIKKSPDPTSTSKSVQFSVRATNGRARVELQDTETVGFYRPFNDKKESEFEGEEEGGERIESNLKDISADSCAEDSCNTSEDDETDDDDSWITPDNIDSKCWQLDNSTPEEDTEQIDVACFTTDFAMQNVLRQMGLTVVSLSGVVIRESRTWILRCYTCFHTTGRMGSHFCPKCGNSTMKRVFVTVNEDGSQQIHICGRRPISKRGKKFSLPKPQGGKHAVNPILVEDQIQSQQRQSRLAMSKTNAFGDLPCAGIAPFVLHDVNSRSATIGVPGHGTKNNLYWMKKNPNQGHKVTGNRKKKQRG